MNTILEKSFDYFLKSDFAEYADGEWLAIHNDKVISHGKILKEVVEEAKKHVPSSKFLLSRVKKTASFL